VAAELERVLTSLLREPVKVTAAGRTDAGVHATGQVISFRSAASFPFDRLAAAANAELPDDIAIKRAGVVDENFSARFCAVERAYVYAVYNEAQRTPLMSRWASHVWHQLDPAAAQAGARYLIGEHDFRSFCGSLPQSGPTVRTVSALNVTRLGPLLRIEVRADGFLHHMVRTIVGTLLECATGRRSPSSLKDVLEARQRPAAGPTAPPQGLYLAGVRYRDGFDSFAEPPVFGRCLAP